MALDALAIKALVAELSDKLLGGRIDKVHQPERDEILLNIRTLEGAYKVVLSASAAHPRLHFTNETKKNPLTPPMFCMLMRKHIGSGKIIGISQTGFERIIQIDVEAYDELGDLSVKHIIVEIMGRHSNIILTAENMKIIDSLKHVDFTVSTVRQVLPGLEYVSPPPQNKTALISESIPEIDFSMDGQRTEKAILDKIGGISPLTAREMVFEAVGDVNCVCGELNETQKRKIMSVIGEFAENAAENKFKPCIITDIGSGKVIDFSAVEIKQYGAGARVDYYDTINEVLSRFYTVRDSAERMKQKSADLVKLLNNNLERCAKKLALQKNTLKEAENKERYKIYGDLLMANLYRLKQGTNTAEVENYYEPDCPTVEIPLSPMYTPTQNAQRYYKKYNKAKTAESEMKVQIKNTVSDIDYLESTLAAIQNVTDEADINAIRAELAQLGYISAKGRSKKNKNQEVSKPMHFLSSDGFDIYVGKNNTQNDYLTLKFANTGDLWFHTKNIHGSHVIIKLGTDKNVPKNTLLEAAVLAAYYSKGRESSQVPVDYTNVRNVKKPNGAKPGMVIYDFYNTVYVTPKEQALEKIN